MQVHFSAAQSAMKAAITRHDVTAHDVANVNTAGFSERRPVQVETSPRGTRIGAIQRRHNPSARFSNTDLTEETREQIQNKSSLGANARVFKVQDRMIGEIIDLVG